MKNYFILLISLLVFSVYTTAQTTKYVDNSYLQRKGLSGEKLGAVLAFMSTDGQYQLSNAYISELNGSIRVGKEDNKVNFMLIPAAKINYINEGIGRIQDQYTGADGVDYEAPTEEWNKFAFYAQKDTVQLYYLQIETSNIGTVEKKYLTSTSNGKLCIQSAIAGNGISALSQMFAIQGNLKVDFFQPPYYGTFVFSPVVYFSSESGSINIIVGSDNLKAGPVINLTAYSTTDSLFVLSNNRNKCEFALLKVNNAVRVTDVIVNEESVTLINDDPDEQRKSLTATILPENADDKSIRWISNNEEVAIVSEYGEITAKSTGRTYIKAISNDGMKSDSCLVVVKTLSGNTTGNQIIDKTTSVFYNNGKLIINNNYIEKIQVYSITGVLLYSGQVNGTISIPANNFTDIFIVKSSAGWIKKIVKTRSNK
jgi:uncharacterized protein YjdB